MIRANSWDGMGGERRHPILLIAREWRERTLIRAQLMEEGYEVEGYEGPEDLPEGIRPSLIILNTYGQRFSEETFIELKERFGKVPVLVIGDITDRSLHYIGKYATTLFRPVSIEELCKEIRRLLPKMPGQQGQQGAQGP